MAFPGEECWDAESDAVGCAWGGVAATTDVGGGDGERE